MIKLFEDYSIQVDSRQYILGQMRTSENTGEMYFQPLSYYMTLESALVGFYRKLGQDRLSVKEEMSLNEAINILVKTKNEVETLTKETLIDIEESELKVEKKELKNKTKTTKKTTKKTTNKE